MKYEEQLRFLIKSKDFHSNWYKSTYPDVDMLKISPAEHFLKFGAELGRSPNKRFDTGFYVSKYKDEIDKTLNPLIDYKLNGEKKGRVTKAYDISGRIKLASRKVNLLKRKHYTLGFSHEPINQLYKLVRDDEIDLILKIIASYELGMILLRTFDSKQDINESLELFDLSWSLLQDVEFCNDIKSKVCVGILVAYYYLGEKELACSFYENLNDDLSLDCNVRLAFSNMVFDSKINIINNILLENELEPVFFESGCSYDSLYDRVSCNIKIDNIQCNVKVSIIMAVYNSEKTISTAIESILSQTWNNIELLVIDDCSTDNTINIINEYIAVDSRVKLIKLPSNSGAYIARNKALEFVTGDYVTLHDADDWSHPRKIQRQVEYLLNNLHIIGCTSEQIRTRNDFSFLRISSQGNLITRNISSFMFRYKPVRAMIGCWDTVRFGADTEFTVRIQKIFGKTAIEHLKTGPLSFQRDTDSSAIGDEYFGSFTMPHGVRQEYFEAQSLFHKKENLKLNGSSVFYSPRPMHVNKKEAVQSQHFDVVIISDFRMQGGSTQSNLEEIKAHKVNGIKTGIVQMYRYDFDANPNRIMLETVREAIDGKMIHSLVYGENITCDTLIIRYPPILQYKQKYIPNIKANNIKVIVNQPPMSDYTDEGVLRYDLKTCSENIRQYWKKDAIWYPIGPLVRDALLNHHADELSHIELSKHDWNNIIDIDGWKRDFYQPQGKLKIGRHSRDHFVKWPGSKETILAAYPECEDIEVHVLGGVKAPSELLGYTPNNWLVHDFGSVHPKDFLKDIDVYLYYSHPDWVEAFGRVIIEAMAVGVPVILPEIYKPLFKEAALYADEYSAVKLAQKLVSDPVAYQNQVAIALKYANENFSYKTHLNRIKFGIL